MLIYKILFSLLIIFSFFLKIAIKNRRRRNLIYIYLSGFIMSIVMGLRHYSVGTDIKQYLYRYNNLKLENVSVAILKEEVGYEILNEFLRLIKVGDQGLIFILSLTIILSFCLFYYKFSSNTFLSIYLHIGIGLFVMSMSGIRQTLAICILLKAYDYIKSKKLLKYMFCILVAYSFHKTAIVFLPVYLINNIIIKKKEGILILILTTSMLFFRKFIPTIMLFLTPEKYLKRYELLSETSVANPLLVMVALSIPLLCLFFWSNIEAEGIDILRMNSNFYMISCINLLFNILSLNSSMIGRLSFYFIPFNMVLIPNVISKIENHSLKSLAIVMTILISTLYFFISVPGGVYSIENYHFFWQ